MEKSPLISVIIPVYKVEKYLDRCVRSVVEQTYSNLEIILIDDGSPDNCPSICDAWAKKDSRIVVVHKRNEGVAEARNTGIQVSTGDFVAFIDSDDWIDKNYYEILCRKLLECNCDMVVSEYRIVENDNEVYTCTAIDRHKIINMNQAMTELINDKRIWRVVWNKIYKRELITNEKFESGKYHEDVFWMYPVVGKSDKICVLDYDGYNYFQRADSIMGVGFSIKRMDAIEAKSYRQEYLEKNFSELADIGRIDLHFTCIYFGQQALMSMDKEEIKNIFTILNRYISKYPVAFSLAKSQRLDNMIYLLLSKRALKLVCKIRNMLKIGI